jgi:hypothetical protein
VLCRRILWPPLQAPSDLCKIVGSVSVPYFTKAGQDDGDDPLFMSSEIQRVDVNCSAAEESMKKRTAIL